MKRIVIISLFAVIAWAQPVAKVMDGDTFELTDGTKVRLHCIDAPELAQPGGQEARGFLSALVLGQAVTINKTGVDKYGRVLAEVIAAGALVNLRMVEAGQAWRFVRYCQDARYESAEKAARGANSGLWASANPVAPWDYRHPQAAPVAAQAIAAPEKPKTAASNGGLMRGPKGGCYYLTPSGSKRYVNRSACD